MIAPRNNLPLLEDQHGEVRAFETGWLLAALERAAVKAGYFEWWLAEHVLSSVCSYLGGVYTKNVVGLGRLQKAVRQALRDIGYKEIARCFEAESPVSHISLLRCAQTLDPVELGAFYEMLSVRVDDLHQSGLTTFHFSDLEACLLYINGTGNLDSELQSATIVDAIREKFASLQWNRDVNCLIL